MSTDGHTFAYPATDEAARIAAEEATKVAAETEAQRQAATADTSSIGSAISDIAWGTLEVVGEVGGAVLELVAGLAE